uniref:Uncharacterized protein n=1 Tax=Arundo donax TaxID=35708 RepID=A0A0A8ZG92_ARUDO
MTTAQRTVVGVGTDNRGVTALNKWRVLLVAIFCNFSGTSSF